MKFFLSAVFALVFCATFGQDYRPGFIVMANGDSLKGYVDNAAPKKNSAVCSFKTSLNAEKQTFGVDELKAFGIDGYRFYESRLIRIGDRKERAFVEALVKGRVSLYKHLGLFYLSKDSIFLLPPPRDKEVIVGNSKYLVADSRYIDLLNMAFVDCKMKNGKPRYYEKGLTDVVQRYNECMGVPVTTPKTSKSWTKISARGFVAFDQASVNLSGFENFSMNQSRTVPFGLGIDISSPRISDRTFFLLEAWRINKSFQGYSEETLPNSLRRTDIYFNSNFIKVPIGLQLNLKRESSTPYLKFGFSQYFLTSFSASAISETEASGIVMTYRYSVPVNPRNQSGIWIGAGYSKRMSLVSLFAEARYERNNGFVSGNGLSSSGSAFNILFGLTY
jgi:hypothetical protein